MLTFVYNFSDGHIMLKPDNGVLRIEDPGYVYMFCNASGYPDPQYDWTYNDDEGSHSYTNDKCLKTGENGKVRILGQLQQSVAAPMVSLMFIYTGLQFRHFVYKDAWLYTCMHVCVCV